jgi:hypothetical protein
MPPDIVNQGSYTAMARKSPKGSKNVPVTEVEVRAVRLELPLNLHKEFRIEAAKEDASMAAIARKLVEEWMAKRKAGSK